MFWKMTHSLALMLTIAVVAGIIGIGFESVATKLGAGMAEASTRESVAQDDQKPDIQWFKDQMKISDKYVAHQEGVLRMSWAHFLTMVFLVVFALGAVVVFMQRQKRTREILETIRKEMAHGDSG